jgi:FAD/FMN-containing dehydrogenase
VAKEAVRVSSTWSNWSGAVVCRPERIEFPRDENEVAAVVQSAAAAGRTVRVVGTGHSSTGIVGTDHVLVSLDRLSGLAGRDKQASTARLYGGTKLHAAGGILLEAGLSMKNLGDIDVQSIGGAVGTGTHGTGPTLGNIPSNVTGIRLVDGSGDIVDLEPGSAELRAARVAVGALGLYVQIELHCLPAFRLHERTWVEPVGQTLERLDDRIATNRSYEFFWMPASDSCYSKTLNMTGLASLPGTPRAAIGAEGERIGWSAHIIPSVRENKFHEMEYAIPAEAGPECFARIRQRFLEVHAGDVQWPIEYRTVAADDAMLSPHGGRASVTLSLHQAAHLPYRDFFTDIEPIFWDYGGRPHWGKFNTMTREQFRAVYPRWDDFCAVRERFDPAGRFLSPYLKSIF